MFGVLISLCSCFPHVINLAVQAIYATIKNGKGFEGQYILGGLQSCFDKAALKRVVLPQGVTVDDYLQTLTSDISGTA